MRREAPADVVIVGAGPTGLLLAGDLALAGLDVLVYEREIAPSDLSRAFAVHARTLEQLDARVLADPLIASGHAVDRLRLDNIAIDLSGLPSRFPFVLVAPQHHTERLLEQRARSAGALISRGSEVTGLRQDREGVEVHARGPGGRSQIGTASYLVAADGADSTVRSALRLPFPGRSVLRSVLLADVRLSRPPPDALTVAATGAGVALLAPFGDGWYRVIAWNSEREDPVTAPAEIDEIRLVTSRVLGDDFGMHDPRWTARVRSDDRQVPSYHVGRIFLAGDAAHEHSPVGGQGLNSGLQDAANLSWKLASVVHGTADPGLLDTYHAERHQVGKLTAGLSHSLLRPLLVEPGALRQALGAAATMAARFGPVADRAARAISGIALSYPAGPGSHRQAGLRAPDVDLRRGWHPRLYEALRDSQFVLLVASETAAAELRPLLTQWLDRVQVVVPAIAPAPLMLIRPDGYVAWATDDRAPVRRYSGLRQALNRWCGPPAGQPVIPVF